MRTHDSRPSTYLPNLGIATTLLALASLALANPAVSNPAAPRPGSTGQHASQAEPRALDDLTALEVYVRSPDPAYSFSVERTIPGDGFRTHIVRMTSQAWLTKSQVDRPVWWHWLVVVEPDEVRTNKAMLFIGGGDNDDAAPEEASPLIVQPALATGSVAAELRMVPNQPLTFVGDAFGPRKEDQLIAYGWDQFLRGGAREHDALWLARLPMTKAAVRAMDTITSMFAERDRAESSRVIDQFVVAGGSKRGWTTWTTAIVDSRVIAIAPFVIDMLNVVPSFQHHWQAYGFWAPAVYDYKSQGLMEWLDRPEYARLHQITEPYSYRQRLTLPKYVVNASGDQFFLPDSWKFYWHDMVGEKHLRYVPNADHSLGGSDAPVSFQAFYRAIVEGRSLPTFDWTVEGDTITVIADRAHPPTEVKVWRAHNPKQRDFRVAMIKRTWESESLALSDLGHYVVSQPDPETGWTAFFIELTYGDIGPEPFKATTGIQVVPETLPFGPYQPKLPLTTAQ